MISNVTVLLLLLLFWFLTRHFFVIVVIKTPLQKGGVLWGKDPCWVSQGSGVTCGNGVSRERRGSGLQEARGITGFAPKQGESESETRSVVSNSANSSGQNTGVGSLSLLQEIFPTEGSNPGLLYCRQILSYLSHQESPHWNILILLPIIYLSISPSSSFVRMLYLLL